GPEKILAGFQIFEDSPEPGQHGRQFAGGQDPGGLEAVRMRHAAFDVLPEELAIEGEADGKAFHGGGHGSLEAALPQFVGSALRLDFALAGHAFLPSRLRRKRMGKSSKLSPGRKARHAERTRRRQGSRLKKPSIAACRKGSFILVTRTRQLSEFPRAAEGVQ